MVYVLSQYRKRQRKKDNSLVAPVCVFASVLFFRSWFSELSLSAIFQLCVDVINILLCCRCCLLVSLFFIRTQFTLKVTSSSSIQNLYTSDGSNVHALKYCYVMWCVLSTVCLCSPSLCILALSLSLFFYTHHKCSTFVWFCCCCSV